MPNVDKNRSAKKDDRRRQPAAKPTARGNLPQGASRLSQWDLERAEDEGMTAPAPPEENPPRVEGEGSYTAARRYSEGVARSVAKGDSEQLAAAAARALDGPEGPVLREAEQAATRRRGE